MRHLDKDCPVCGAGKRPWQIICGNCHKRMTIKLLEGIESGRITEEKEEIEMQPMIVIEVEI